MFVAKNAMLFFLCCFVIVTSAFPEGPIDSENVSVSAEDGAGGRIAGGEEPDRGPKAAPYQAQITREGATFCSGTIINEQYIVTAAHCVEGAKPEELTVRVGTNIRGEGLVVPIEKIVQHPDYDYPQNNFDIAYMRTAEDIPLLPYVTSLRPAFIDSRNASVPNELYVTGWGYQEDNQQKLAKNIRAVNLTIINNVECQVFYPLMSITKNMICGYNLRDMDKGTCVGDGGDPATEGLRLVGVSSAARGCGPGMAPSVFTYVDAEEIRNFILNGTSVTGSQRTAGDPNYPDYTGETTTFPEYYSDYVEERPEDASEPPIDDSDYDGERPEDASQHPIDVSDYDERPEDASDRPTDDSDYDGERPEDASQHPIDVSDYDERQIVLQMIQIMIRDVLEMRQSILQMIQVMMRLVREMRKSVRNRTPAFKATSEETRIST